MRIVLALGLFLVMSCAQARLPLPPGYRPNANPLVGLNEEEAKPKAVTAIAYEAAVILKDKENEVKYEPIFQEGKAVAIIEDKELKVEIRLGTTLDPRTRESYRTLETTVTDGDQKIAFQRQYSFSKGDDFNQAVFEFVHPRTHETYVVGMRNSARK